MLSLRTLTCSTSLPKPFGFRIMPWRNKHSFISLEEIFIPSHAHCNKQRGWFLSVFPKFVILIPPQTPNNHQQLGKNIWSQRRGLFKHPPTAIHSLKLKGVNGTSIEKEASDRMCLAAGQSQKRCTIVSKRWDHYKQSNSLRIAFSKKSLHTP